jgi:hypothetical protein
MPIVNVEGIGRIEFPDSMTREQIDAAVKNDILPVFRQRTAGASSPDSVAALANNTAAGAAAPPPQMGPNPFSKGTARANANFHIGDRYRYRVVDVLSKIESRQYGRTVTAITDAEVIFNKGNQITDLLGNTIKNSRGQTFTGSQIFVAEYSLGRKWTTTYRGTQPDLVSDVWTITFKVVDREPVTVPAGAFDAFKVEGDGYITDRGNRLQITYWVAPEKLRSFIAYEQITRNRRNRLTVTDRTELISFKEAG